MAKSYEHQRSIGNISSNAAVNQQKANRAKPQTEWAKFQITGATTKKELILFCKKTYFGIRGHRFVQISGTGSDPFTQIQGPEVTRLHKLGDEK